jgi:hypothetical protein
MDEQLLNELYGIDPNEQYDANDEMIKAAQAELIEAVADEAGVDLNEMDDDELEKFASYVLAGESVEEEFVEDDMFAQADQMGRVMAHAYADEQEKIASYQLAEAGYEDVLEETASTWEMMKIARKGADFAGYGEGDRYTRRGFNVEGRVGEDFGELTNRQKMQIGRRRFGKDGDTRRTLKDMGVRKRDYLRALAGRATGFYDLSTARDLGKSLSALKDSMTEKEYKALMKEVREVRKAKGAYGKLSNTGRKSLIGDAMRMRGGSLPDMRSPSLVNRAERLKLIAAAQDARRGLALRGGGKMALTAAGIGALGYGANRAMGNK